MLQGQRLLSLMVVAHACYYAGLPQLVHAYRSIIHPILWSKTLPNHLKFRGMSGDVKLVCYPQMTFETGGPELRGDVEETERFGREDFEKVLIVAIRGAFQRYNADEK